MKTMYLPDADGFTAMIYMGPPTWVLLLWLLGMGLLLLIFLRPARRDRGRRMGDMTSWRYAHRGLHDAQRPENSLAAFRAAAERGLGVELDVRLTRDGKLVVSHDSELLRMCNQVGVVEEWTAAELKTLRLSHSTETIPLLEEVLPLFVGKAPLVVELKTHGGNYAALTAAACASLAQSGADYCLESFDPRCLLLLRLHRPEIPRGQLSQNFSKNSGDLAAPVRFALSHLLGNFLTYPDFIAYRFSQRDAPALRLCRALWKPAVCYWTIRSAADLQTAESDGACGIFEGFTPEGSRKGDPI